MKDLVSDRDSQRALAIIKTKKKRWSCLVSEKGLLGFFANGFAANEIQESPGGFTIFMFKPITATHTKDQKGRQQQVRSMFGSTELDEDAIEYYAENDFYPAETLEGLEEQIYTCIKCLEKFTERHGIEGNYPSRQCQARAQRTHDEKQIEDMAGLEDAACSEEMALGVFNSLIIIISYQVQINQATSYSVLTRTWPTLGYVASLDARDRCHLE
jgi:hypothetical protein